MPEPKPITELAKGPGMFLLYGPPGAGKTALATSFGEGAEILDIGKGLQTALTFKDKFYEERRKCLFNPCYDDNPAMPQAWMKLKSRVFEIGQQGPAYKNKCLIIDELSAINQASLRYILFNGNRLFGLMHTPTTKNGITQPEWGLAMQEILNLVVVLKSLRCHVILIAHDVTEDDMDASKKNINALGRKLAPQLPGYFDEVLHMKVDQQTRKRSLQSQPTWDVVARTRGQLPNPYDPDKGMRQLMIDAGFSPELT